MRKKWGKSIKGINKNPLWKTENLINLTMKNLNYDEMKAINGGLVPSSFYMDDATIAQNGKSFAIWGEMVWSVAKPFFREIIKFASEIV